MTMVWTEADEQAHLDECPNTLDISTFANATPRQLCGCGESARHTPLAVAWAELEVETPSVVW